VVRVFATRCDFVAANLQEVEGARAGLPRGRAAVRRQATGVHTNTDSCLGIYFQEIVHLMVAGAWRGVRSLTGYPSDV
jgi:hypothetical protein